MEPEWWPGEEHEAFVQWAISEGVVVDGVGPARFQGRGLGMIAMRDIQEDEVIVRVPQRVMLTVEAVPSSFASKFPEKTPVHAILAAFLCNGEPDGLEPYQVWRKTWPSRQDFEDCMPILWPENTYLLPPSISGHWKRVQKRSLEFEYESSHQNILAQQKARLRNAWNSVLAVFPQTDWESFSYHWLIVNTRSFFYLMPGQEPPEDRNDAMALLPLADYFNHSDMACNVMFDGQEYVFRAAKAYNVGEEVFISYGPHTNDFLFTEYGFYLDANQPEALYLDDIIFQDISPSFQEELNLQQYYGNYQVTATGVCYRTEIAACIKYMSLEDWQNYALGYSTRGVDAEKSAKVIREWIGTYIEEASANIDELEKRGYGNIGQKHEERSRMLLKRWVQVKDLCLKALDEVI
ncbi:hypothetical protein BJY01DRAFT_232081 [Aspergillus pseudoustus]|uniref:SET domain-containing protein n=1 Tax=Aspergillus pseudoustus TaxID=1810923 RepID=A0ABR4KPF3_9EURO